MMFHAVFVGGVADGEHRALRQRESVYRIAVSPKLSVRDFDALSMDARHASVAVRYGIYTLRHFRVPLRRGDIEEFYFYAPQDMSDADAFRHLLMGYTGGVKGDIS